MLTKDKRVVALVRAFLKAGILTELGDREESYSGPPPGRGAKSFCLVSGCFRDIEAGPEATGWA